MISAVLALLGIYLMLGIIFAIAFILRGARMVDPTAAGASLRVRVIFIPGAIALWPLVSLRWIATCRGREAGGHA